MTSLYQSSQGMNMEASVRGMFYLLPYSLLTPQALPSLVCIFSDRTI